MNNRRKLVIALGAGALAAPFASFAQQQGKVWRIGILHPNSPATGGRLLEAFTQGLQELGYVEGKNISIEYRFAEGNVDRLPTLAVELSQRKVDVIFASNSTAAQAAKRATSTIPIVFATVGEPVESGLVATLAHPGGNVTGTSLMSSGLSAKRLQLLKESFPRLSHVAVQISSEPNIGSQFAEVQRAAKILGMEVLSIDIRHRDDFERGLTVLRKWGAHSMYILESATNARNRTLLAEFALSARLVTIASTRTYAEAGALISYGADYASNYHRAANYVDKILKGAKPGDIPVEQPTKFEFIVNQKTAKALGIKVPNSFLVRATKVIE